MAHYRIKEIIKGENKEFYIEFTKKILWFFVWKKHNKIPYQKYEDAILESKRIINVERDYTEKVKDSLINYHYIDAFRLNKPSPKINSTPEIRKKQKNEEFRYNKSVFIPKNIQK